MKSNERPVISVIIPSYNSGNLLRAAVDSITCQTYRDWEVIIVDGASGDRSLGFLEGNVDDRIQVISERDEGIYDAMNRGIERASGKWLYFLGADDYLCNSLVLASVVKIMDDADIVVGSVKYDNGLLVPAYFGRKLLFFNKLHHQGAFYSRRLFDSFRYDKARRVVSDYELNFIAYHYGLRCKRIDDVISVCGSLGVSRHDSIINYCDMFMLRRPHISALRNSLYFFVGVLNFLRRMVWA